jgi:hypothetical protein
MYKTYYYISQKSSTLPTKSTSVCVCVCVCKRPQQLGGNWWVRIAIFHFDLWRIHSPAVHFDSCSNVYWRKRSLFKHVCTCSRFSVSLSPFPRGLFKRLKCANAFSCLQDFLNGRESQKWDADKHLYTEVEAINEIRWLPEILRVFHWSRN